MIHPSYKELIEKINEGQESDEAPVISSRYSLVLAASKRARQLIAGAEPKVKVKKGMKPLSVAVEEMYKGEVTILPEEITADETSEDVE
ncbi:MAG TPA: DNA-directed RNA polymerase subunit omega [Candidatus Fusicatenibacter intestinigallinarum]|uniref:DNA-directed RNA polymerase subunit omega n=1 Tax=Candidatus Fusicatenibacter intestinigallinarum TaxID=2838598 RepID=A0A9D2SMW5_9FIRM|nr:DNA-directed RNA polymerase subunit omega [Candidatus Fusicatenibacter intestinigallinarum]